MKAQSTQISVILLFLITLTLITMVYVWGNPIIQRGRAAVSYEYSLSKLSEVRSAVSSVSATEGSQYTVDINLEGVLFTVLEGAYINQTNETANNSIQLRLLHTSNLAGSWVLIDPEEDDMSHIGNLSSDRSGVILGRSDGAETILRLWYRDLYDNHTDTTYEIRIIAGEILGGGGSRRSIVVRNNGTTVSGNTVTTDVVVGLV